MKCVICKVGEVGPKSVQAEIKVGSDRLLVPVEAEACVQCGEVYYSSDTLRHLEQVREDFERRTIAPPSVGTVYRVA